jgi:hypothetical protein
MISDSKRTRKWVVAGLGMLTALGVLLGVTNAGAKGVKLKIEIAEFALEEGVFPAIFAKEVCTCVLVDGLSVAECQANDNLPSVAHDLASLPDEDDILADHVVESEYYDPQVIADELGKLVGKERTEAVVRTIKGLVGNSVHVAGKARAVYDPANPEFGCTITVDPGDQPASAPAARPVPPADDTPADPAPSGPETAPDTPSPP